MYKYRKTVPYNISIRLPKFNTGHTHTETLIAQVSSRNVSPRSNSFVPHWKLARCRSDVESLRSPMLLTNQNALSNSHLKLNEIFAPILDTLIIFNVPWVGARGKYILLHLHRKVDVYTILRLETYRNV